MLAEHGREQLVVMKFGGTSVEDAKAMERTAVIVGGRRRRRAFNASSWFRRWQNCYRSVLRWCGGRGSGR